MKNIAASIRAKLLNIARQRNRDFNAVLLQYFQERFLYRLSISPYKNKLILKGALLLLVYQMPRLRPTKDIDFLGLSPANDVGRLETIIREIITIPAEDGVKFHADSITPEIIREERNYQGLRLKLHATLANARGILQLDVGFGDLIIPEPVEMEFPILLDLPRPIIQTYSRESIIAEKFEAIVYLNFLTSRMKDFYDILFLAQHFTFELKTLRKAIHTTFRQRNTPLEDRIVIYADEFHNHPEKQSQWTAFLNRNELNAETDFSEIVNRIKLFIEDGCEDEMSNLAARQWNPEKWTWEP